MTISSIPTLTIRTRFITGMVCTQPGIYIFDIYADHSAEPHPESDEKTIAMRYGNVFPPVRSASKSAWWKLEKKL